MSEPSALIIGLWRRIRARISRHDITLDSADARRAERTAVDPDLAAYLWAHREVFGPWLAEASAAGDLADQLVRWLHRNNQFLYATAQNRAALADAYGAMLTDAAEALGAAGDEAGLSARLPALMSAHHDRLDQALRDAFGARLQDAVWAEYSPTLQLIVLGLAEIHGPVLDVGCGATGALVAHLRAAGLEAIGMDRDAEAPGTVVGDWLTQDYGRDTWGTVISHLGFSLHFLHHHLAEHDLAYDYARAYRRILASLKVGGSFAYAPALPFVEDVLGDDYRVARRVAGRRGVSLPIESSAVVTRLA